MASHPKRGPRPADFALTTGELRAVTSFAVASAERVLPAFEVHRPDDARPREALAAARAFIEGASDPGPSA